MFLDVGIVGSKYVPMSSITVDCERDMTTTSSAVYEYNKFNYDLDHSHLGSGLHASLSGSIAYPQVGKIFCSIISQDIVRTFRENRHCAVHIENRARRRRVLPSQALSFASSGFLAFEDQKMEQTSVGDKLPPRWLQSIAHSAGLHHLDGLWSTAQTSGSMSSQLV